MYTCVCEWVTLLDSRKLAEHFKPDIMEKIKIIIINKSIMLSFQKKLEKIQSCKMGSSIIASLMKTLFFNCLVLSQKIHRKSSIQNYTLGCGKSQMTRLL